MELYNVLAQVYFSKSKTKLDIELNKPRIRAASRVAEQHKT